MLITCPDCGRQVSPAAPTCLGCGRPIAAYVPVQQPFGATHPGQPVPVRHAKTSKGMWLVIGIFVVFGMWSAISLFRVPTRTATEASEREANALRKAPVATATTKPAEELPAVGEDGYLWFRGSKEFVPMFPTEKDYDDFVKAAAARDRFGMNATTHYMVKPGIQVKVIETHWTTKEIRVLDGPHLGKRGWILSTSLHRAAPTDSDLRE